MSLQSEIELRRARLAELRRQRDAHAENVSITPPVQQLEPKPNTLVVSTGPLFALEPPILYDKATQTDYALHQSILPHEPETVTQESTVIESKPKFTLGVTDPDSSSVPLDQFLDNAWRALTRANAGARPIKAYHEIQSSSTPLAGSSNGGAIVEELKLGGSNITNVAWSPIFPELVATCGAQQSEAHVWSLDAPDAPEYTLSSATIITCLMFSQRNANILLGGGSNGQILRWNLDAGGRSRLLPSLRSQLDGNGHREAIIAIEPVPGAAADDLFATLSSDGSICTWLPDMLAHPQTRVGLVPPPRSALESSGVSGVPSTALALHPHHLSGAFVGTLAGQIEWISWSLGASDDIYDRNQEPVYASAVSVHDGPITSIAVRPLRPGAADASDGCWMLSAALDWKICLWSIALAPTESSELMVKVLEIVTDVTVYDLAWCPHHPSIFAAACDTGLQVWDLARSRAAAMHTFSILSPLYKLKWSRAGASSMHICASGPGGAQVFALPVVEASEAKWPAFAAMFRND